MAIKTQSKKVTYERLYTATIAAQVASAKSQTSNTRLDNGISAEITGMVIRSPLDANGAGELAEYVTPYIDGKAYDGGNMLQVRSDLDSAQMPPVETMRGDKLIGPEAHGIRRNAMMFGLGLPDLAMKPQSPDVGLGNNILLNTTVKCRPGGTLAVEFKNGTTATTDNWVVELWGYKYHSEQALQEYMARVYGNIHKISMFDKNAMRSFSFNYPAIPALIENWGKMVGGQDQDGKSGNEVIVKKLIRWARNAKATTANNRYDLSLENDQVDNPYNDMKFDPEDDKMYVINKLGVLASANHQQTFIRVNEQDILDARTGPNYNPLVFGRETEIAASSEMYNHRFKGMPIINPVFIHGETGKVQFLDNGTAIPDGTNTGAGSLAALEALIIQTDQIKDQ